MSALASWLILGLCACAIGIATGVGGSVDPNDDEEDE